MPKSETSDMKDRARDSSAQPANSSSPANAGSLLGKLKARNTEFKEEKMTVDEWMELCKTDSSAYESYADRLLKAIGKPEIVDTRNADTQTRLVYSGKKVARYAPFKDLYDSEAAATKLVTRIQNGARIVVLRGPVGSGKTEMATILEKMMEKQPIYLLKCKVTQKISPFNDSPLCLFSKEDVADQAAEELDIPRRYLNHMPSAWVTKRLKHHEGDFDAAFEVVRVYPSRERQLAIAKLDPKDPKTADMDSLVGSVNMALVGEIDPLDKKSVMGEGNPDAYTPGILSLSNGGIFHAAEFFRNNSALMNTFLEGVTTGYFTGNSGIGVLPMNQLIVITTNEPVWREFKAKHDSDAARNRIEVVDVPYTMRKSEEQKIYSKLLKQSKYVDMKMAPGTLELMSKFAIATRLRDGINNGLKAYDPFIRVRVMDGEVPDGSNANVPKLHEIRAKATPEEGLEGFTIRDADRVLKDTFNARASEGIQEADTILLIETLRNFINSANPEDISSEEKIRYMGFVDKLATENKEKLEKLVNSAIIGADPAMTQRVFDEYMNYAEAWVQSSTMYTDSGEPINYAAIEKFLTDFEKRSNITNGPEFRKAAVNSINSEIKRIANWNKGKMPDEQKELRVKWDSYEPVAKVIRAQYEMNQGSRQQILRAKMDTDLRSPEERRQFKLFHDNMREAGYTETMVSRVLHHLSYV